jgi:prepilin peptidase CpaA
MVLTVLLLGLLTVAAATDALYHRIYNWTTYPGILAALAINGLATAWAARWAAGSGADPRSFCTWLGWIDVWDSFFGFLVCGGVLLVCFVFFRLGGGDVKLMAMMGAFVGVNQGVIAMLWTFVLGGCTGVIVLVWRVGPLRLAAAVFRHLLWTIRLGRVGPLTPQQRAQLQPPLFLAPSALAAAVIVQFHLLERWGIAAF